MRRLEPSHQVQVLPEPILLLIPWLLAEVVPSQTATTSVTITTLPAATISLCRNSFLQITRWCTGCDTDRNCWWNLFFYRWFNYQCGNWSYHTKYKYCRNLYCHLYHGCCRWLCCTDCNDFGNHHNFTCCNDLLCRNTLLFFARCSAVGNSDRNCRWNLFFHCRINHQCCNRRYYT